MPTIHEIRHLAREITFQAPSSVTLTRQDWLLWEERVYQEIRFFLSQRGLIEAKDGETFPAHDESLG